MDRILLAGGRPRSSLSSRSFRGCSPYPTLLRCVVSFGLDPLSSTGFRHYIKVAAPSSLFMHRSPLIPVSVFAMPNSQLPPLPHASAKRRRESTSAAASSSTRTSKRSRQILNNEAACDGVHLSPSEPTTITGSSSEPSSSKSPSQRSHAKAAPRSKDATKSRARKEREDAWRQWCDEHRWEPKDDPGYKQKVGSKEVHRSDGECPLESGHG